MRSRRRATLAAGLSIGFGVGVPAVVLLAGLQLGVLDPLRSIDNPVAAAAAARRASARAVTPVPALTDLTAALTAGPAGSAGDGAIVSGASLPSAVACVPSPITPVVTVSRGYTVAAAQITVTLAAYVAGAGGPVFDSQFGGVPTCTVPGGGSSVAPGTDGGPGVAGFSISTLQTGQVTTTQVWRRGDVIAYLSGTDPATEAGLASAMDATLAHALGSDCADQMSLTTDDVRDPFAVGKRTDFKGLTVDQGINQPPTPLPSPTRLPVGGSPSAFVQVSEGPLGVTLPAPSPAATPSKPPWPVYPPLPTATPVPVPPSAPSSLPPTHAPLRESQVDGTGPGCGWAFTGMLTPTPPSVLTQAQLAAKQAALQPLLARDQAAWQASVNAYWVAFTSYLGQAQGYASYTDAVNQVSAAWSVIDGQWETYFALKAAYDQMVTDRKNFLTAQMAAQASYAANQATCTPSPIAPAPVAPVPGAPVPGAPVPGAPAPGVSAAPMDAHARAADTPSPSASASTGGGLFPPAPGPSPTPTASVAPTAAPSDTAAPPTDAPPVTTTTAPAAPVPVGTPCEDPPAILSQTPPPAPTGPPPTKPADPRPSKTPGGSASPTHS